MKLKGYVPNMLSKSRFCRRLHRLADFLVAMFYGLGKQLKDLVGAANYRLDSFPLPVCDNIRIAHAKILQGESFRGKQVAMRRYLITRGRESITRQGAGFTVAGSMGKMSANS